MAKRKVKVSLKDPSYFEDPDYAEMVAEDRMMDPNQPKNITPNTDDEGNPIVTKDKIYMAPTKSEREIRDQRMYEQNTALPKRMREGDKSEGNMIPDKKEIMEKRKKFMVQLAKYAAEMPGGKMPAKKVTAKRKK